jgi:outer membrane cobalamin receptor
VETWSVLAIAAVAAIAIQSAQAAETSNKPAETEEVTVIGEATGSLTSVSPEESRKEKAQVPGGFTIKTAEEMKRGRASNFEDLLQRAPGVFLQSENGTEVSKISIRGSGITSEDEPLGVMFSLDGLSYNQGDGEAILEDFDVAALSVTFRVILSIRRTRCLPTVMHCLVSARDFDGPTDSQFFCIART